MAGPVVTPIKVGLLADYPTQPRPGGDDTLDGFRLIFEEAFESRLIDRPIELVERRVTGLPNGSYRAVERAYDELVEEDCLVIFGPYVSENVVPLRRHVESRQEVAIITMAGSEAALGDYVFALNNGSMEEEPLILAAVMRHDGRKKIAVAFESSLIGRDYLSSFRDACTREGLIVVAEVAIPQIESDKIEAIGALQKADADALLHVGFGHGLWGMRDALDALGWNPPRYTTTAFELAYINESWGHHISGFVGLDSYDERNLVGQAFLDRFEARYGRRPGYYAPCYAHDAAIVIVNALARARPLTGPGVKDALERVKMIPAASGAPGTKLRFGRYIRQGWMGADYLVARYLFADGITHVFHGTSEGTLGPVEARNFDQS